MNERQSKLKFVVTGTGRAGTTYMARVFNELAIRCGHEVVFDHRSAPSEAWDVRTDLVGDASWCAVPYLANFGGVVFHQMRDPLRVLSSWLAVGLFTAPVTVTHQSSLKFLDRHFERGQDGFAALVRWIVEWNERCEPYAHMRWNIEDLDAETLARATRLIGHPRPAAQCQVALATVPTNANSMGEVAQLGWDDLPDDENKARLIAFAERYGYATPESMTPLAE